MNRRLLSLADQVIASGANLGLSIGIARIYGADEFAGFGFGLTIAMMIQSIQRGGFVVPLSMMTKEEIAAERDGLLSAHALMIAVFVGLGFAGYGAAKLLGAGPLVAGALAATVACLAAQTQIDVIRVFSIKAGRPALAFGYSLAQAATFSMILAAGVRGLLSFETAMLSIGALLLVAGTVVLLPGSRPNIAMGHARLRRFLAQTLGWATLGTISSWAYTHFPLLALGAVAPPIHAAAFTASRSLMQPVQILARSADLVDKHDLSGAGAAKGRLFQRFALRNLLLVAVIGGLVAAFAEPMLRLVYGAPFSAFADTLRLWAAVFAILPFLMLLEGMIHAGGHLRGYTVAQVVAGLVALLATPLLVGKWLDLGAVAACFVGWLTVTGGAALILWRARGQGGR